MRDEKATIPISDVMRRLQAAAAMNGYKVDPAHLPDMEKVIRMLAVQGTFKVPRIRHQIDVGLTAGNLSQVMMTITEARWGRMLRYLDLIEACRILKYLPDETLAELGKHKIRPPSTPPAG